MITFPKTVTLTWVDPNPVGLVTQQIVTRNGTQIASVPGGTLTYVDTVSAAGEYAYTVTAESASDTAAPTAVAIALISLLPVSSLDVVVN